MHEGDPRAVPKTARFPRSSRTALEPLAEAAAEACRGRTVEIEDDDRADLGRGEWQPEDLAGLSVVDHEGRTIGRALGVMPTGGVDLLRVEPERDDDEELLIPLAETILLAVERHAGRIVVRPPDGLLELNRRPDAS